MKCAVGVVLLIGIGVLLDRDAGDPSAGEAGGVDGVGAAITGNLILTGSCFFSGR